MSELKPCPFCGSSDIDPRSGGAPECFSCGAMAGNSCWNTRATSEADALLEENKRLRGALKPLADEAFQNMAGGKGHLIDDAYCALRGG